MALDLSISFEQSNDNKTITITDTTGTYSADNVTGWGSPNIDVGDIIEAQYSTVDKYHLILDVSITDSTGTETAYTQINLRDHNGADFTEPADLVFEINASHLISSGVVLGTSDDELPDGLYAIDYRIVDASDSTQTETNGVTTTDNYIVDTIYLVHGVVKAAVYDQLRQIPTDYMCNNCKTDEIMEAIFASGYLQAIETSAYVAKQEELIIMLATLESIVRDGSTIIW